MDWLFFFFTDPATTEIYTLSLHDALPISARRCRRDGRPAAGGRAAGRRARSSNGDRKSTRLNSSHSQISYAVFCLKKKISTKQLEQELVQDVELRVILPFEPLPNTPEYTP